MNLQMADAFDRVREGLPPHERMLKVSEVAERLNVSQRQVRKWIACGVLEARRLPFGQFRIPESAIPKVLS